MTITFPRDMPDSGASGQEFEIQRIDYGAPEASGFQGGVQVGFPLWLAVWTLGKMGARRSDVWRAWVSTLRGRQRRFYGRDLARPRPLAFIDGLPSGWSGNATAWSSNVDAYDNGLLGLTGFPPSFPMSIGDYVGFRWTNGGEQRRALVRVVEAAVSSGSGGITLTVEPPVPSCVPPGAIAYVERPTCIMQLVTEQTQLAAIDRRLAIGGGKIVAVQDLRE